MSLDCKDVRDLTDNGSSNEDKLNGAATDYEETDGFLFYQNQLNFVVWCAAMAG